MPPYRFQPQYFKRLSEKLYQNTTFSTTPITDAKNRTIVGRLYYYALLKLRDDIWEIISNIYSTDRRVLKKAHNILYTRRVHKFIPALLDQLGLSHYKIDFKNLQAYRHAADYYINPSKYKDNDLPSLVIDNDTFYNSTKFSGIYTILTTAHLANLENSELIITIQERILSQRESIKDFILNFR